MTYRIDPESQNFPYLRGGTYGRGCDKDCKAQLTGLVLSARDERSRNPDFEGPGYDKTCERDDYTLFEFLVPYEPEGIISLKGSNRGEWHAHSANSGSKAIPWLVNLGVQVASNGEIDESTLPTLPMEVGLEIGDPRPDKKDPNRKFTGYVRRIFQVG